MAPHEPGKGVPVWVVDAFTAQPFAGNPAAVCLLDGPAAEAWMQDVAAEMRHSETAFVHPVGDRWSLRWFTPEREVDLCGHATLASAHVLWSTGAARAGPLTFDTRSGPLACRQEHERIVMTFPQAPAAPVDAWAVPRGLFEALGIPAVEVHAVANGNLLLALPDVEALRATKPDMRALRQVSGTHGYILTAPGDGDVDFCCRYFVPAWGIDEDPATGSIQCTLGPYWSARLGKAELAARQESARGGTLWVRTLGAAVEVSGHAVTVLAGQLVGRGRERFKS